MIQARLTLKENRVRKAAGETGIVNDKIAGHEVVRVGDRQIVDRSDLRGLDALNAIEQNVAVPVQLRASASDGIEGLPQLLRCDLFFSVDPDFIEEPQDIVLAGNRQFGTIAFVLQILVPDDADDAKPQQQMLNLANKLDRRGTVGDYLLLDRSVTAEQAIQKQRRRSLLRPKTKLGMNLSAEHSP